jgi:hypothetical protein
VSADQLGLSENGEEYITNPIEVTVPGDEKWTQLYAGGWHAAALSGKKKMR